MADDHYNVNYTAYERWMKPILEKAEGFGLVFETKRIDFLTRDYQREQSKLYVVAYIDAYLINRFAEMLEDSEYGFTLDLAPPFVDYESSSVTHDDPWFMN